VANPPAQWIWTTYSYDARGRVITETFPHGSATTYAYRGLTTTDTIAKNQTRTVTKDSQGQVVSVTDVAGKTTTYAYGPFGKLIQTADPLGNGVTANYDVRGRKTASSDPDLGHWTYAYDTEVRCRGLRLSGLRRELCASQRGDQHQRQHHQHHLRLRCERQPDLRPRPHHQLHHVQQAVDDRQWIGHAELSHDIDHQRFKQQIIPEGTTTYYFDAFGVHAELVTNAILQWNEYLTAGGALIGMRSLQVGSLTTRYFHTDNLGSIAVITDESGAVVEHDSYDAWGKALPDRADDPAGSIESQTTRGFTGQEELDFGLVHLNGRIGACPRA
jgi:YD repeat-containing protein